MNYEFYIMNFLGPCATPSVVLISPMRGTSLSKRNVAKRKLCFCWSDST